MKQEFDAGTPELLAQRARAAAAFTEAVSAAEVTGDRTKIGGLQFLHAVGTIETKHRNQGQRFSKWCENYHNKHNIRCSLATMTISEGAPEPASEYEDFLNSIKDGAEWFSDVSSRLFTISQKAKRPYGKIVLMVSVFGWSLQDVAKYGGLYRKKKDGKPIDSKTAAAWTHKAFEWLCDVITEIENEHKRKNKL